jgi:DNA-binding response OmpR family regulator
MLAQARTRTPPQGARRAGGEGESMKVLVVEDDVDIQDLVISLLSRAGYDVIVRGTGEAGLAAALTQQPDLVILDWMMPGMTGVEVCRAMRADPRAANITVLMLTSRAQEADIDQAFTAGADDYMVKPFGGRELVSRVRSLTANGAGRIE